MKNFRTLTLVTLLFLCNSVFGQEKTPTKEETENWILEKLTQYTEKDGENFYGRNFTYGFDEYHFIINIEDGEGIYNKVDKILIPIYEINTGLLQCLFGDFQIHCESKNIELYYDNKKVKIDDAILLDIETSPSTENDLCERLIKAFKHLKKFYKKKPKTEVF